MTAGERIQILDLDVGRSLAIVRGEGSAHAVVWPGVDARLRSMHYVRLTVGASTVELAHPSDAVYYVVSGAGSVSDPATGEVASLREGSMFHIDSGTGYVIAAGDEPIELVGGPAPADDALYDISAGS